ncbi:hypothetical protein [Hyphomicrobium sp.]|uniref:hypothetical protein n=1 Tax=Hyphomicrobium sp. TaxID=82 RepID=UPI0025C60087|nr:hypothetical protein [Hyphomicrobium sp.]MCC7250673.1 hypothetical protein [Hyphomicrobium sp.]
MSAYDLVLLILVAGGAFYAGYQVGRFKALAEQGRARPYGEAQPLPGPRVDGPYSEATSVPSRPRGSPPPASAGNEDGTWGGAPSGRTPPRRSTKPPPAAAGLMGTGETEKSGKGQK